MDSLTQAVLGAVVMEAAAGRQIGNRALVWGLWFGTLPDLDILLYPWIEPLDRLGWHRGLSHSLLLMTVTAPLWGGILAWIHRTRALGWLRASWAVWLALSTHVLIDCFTVYGTQIFEPFSNVRVGLNNLFIMDPLFTLPLLAALLILPWYGSCERRRRRCNTVALTLSSLYVVWSFGAKAVAHHRIESALDQQAIPHTRFFTAPTAFNTLLWRGLVEVEDGLLIGYTSLLDPPGRPVRFEFLPRNAGSLGAAAGSRAQAILDWFSQGYWTAESHPEGPRVYDWRFGEIRNAGALGPDNPPVPIFAWQLRPDADGWNFVHIQVPGPPRSTTLLLIWRSLRGEPVF
jgi:inner membrane protein